MEDRFRGLGWDGLGRVWERWILEGRGEKGRIGGVLDVEYGVVRCDGVLVGKFTAC